MMNIQKKNDANNHSLPANFPICELNHQSSLPLYKQIYNHIRDAIASGILKPNQKTPAESELSQLYKVSRITIRKAIAELVENDLLIRRHGKGTFIQGKKIAENFLDEMSFSLTCKINQVRPGSRIDRITVKDANERDIIDLCLKKGDKVLYIARIRYADDVPVIFEHNYFPQRYSFLLFEDLENKSIYQILKEKYQISIVRTVRSLELCQASEYEAECLKIAPGSPTILLREVAYNENDEPVHRTKQIIAGDKFIFTIR